MISGIYVFDIFVLILLLYGLVSGFFRGFFKEIGSVVGLALAFIITFKFGNAFAGFIKGLPFLASYAEYTGAVAYVVLFLIILIVVNLGTSFLLFFVFKVRTLKIFNRVGGLVLGLVKGWLVAVIIYFMVISFGAFLTKYVEDSHSAPYLQGPAKKMQSIATKTLQNKAFSNVLHPPVEIPPPPQAQDDDASATDVPGVRETPMYIPTTDEELFSIESFE